MAVADGAGGRDYVADVELPGLSAAVMRGFSTELAFKFGRF